MSTSQPFAALMSQSAKPITHALRHMPPEHPARELGGDAQAVPHAPQFIGSLASCTQLIPHWVCPASQLDAHTPAAASHTGVAPEHARPHAPQFIVVLSEASQPLAGLRSQSSNPVAHAERQTPSTHEDIAFAVCSQRRAQAPQ